MLLPAGLLAALSVLVTTASSPLRSGTVPADGASEVGPNVVVIFTDDQGYRDVGCYGAVGFETPHLDRLAAEGLRFTSFYVSQAVCSASRASLLTGCYANRIGILGALGPWSEHGLHTDETTIAELLKARGYATGIFGKWHLGHLEPFLPLQHGFDEFFGLPYSNDMWPVDFDGQAVPEDHRKRVYPPLALLEGNARADEVATLADQATLTRRITERAVGFIDAHAHEPFFLYVPHPMPHVPLGVSPDFRGSATTPYGDVIQELDASVGELVAALERHELRERTLVVFTSDNGPWLNFGEHAGSALPLREGKGNMWEGGVRVPCIMNWPGTIPAGGVHTGIAATIDILPTLAELCGARLPEHAIDGLSLAGILRGDTDVSPRASYLYYYGRELQAVRVGDWKLFLPHEYRSYERVPIGQDGHPGPYARGRTATELFELGTDVEERKNVADLHPEVVDRLLAFAARARDELGDRKHEGNGCREPGRLD